MEWLSEPTGTAYLFIHRHTISDSWFRNRVKKQASKHFEHVEEWEFLGSSDEASGSEAECDTGSEADETPAPLVTTQTQQYGSEHQPSPTAKKQKTSSIRDATQARPQGNDSQASPPAKKQRILTKSMPWLDVDIKRLKRLIDHRILSTSGAQGDCSSEKPHPPWSNSLFTQCQLTDFSCGTDLCTSQQVQHHEQEVVQGGERPSVA